MLTNVFIGVNFTPGITSPEQQKTLEFCLQIFHCIFVTITDDGVSHCLCFMISLQILCTCLSTHSAQLCVGSQLRYNHRPRASPEGSGEENTRFGQMSEWSGLTVCLGQNPILQHGHQERRAKEVVLEECVQLSLGFCSGLSFLFKYLVL